MRRRPPRGARRRSARPQIVIISAANVTLTLGAVAPQNTIALGKVADLLAQPDPEIPALRTAIGALSQIPEMVVVQADPATAGVLINRTLRTLRRLGVDRELLAIKVKK
jgi:hypothetical protein